MIEKSRESERDDKAIYDHFPIKSGYAYKNIEWNFSGWTNRWSQLTILLCLMKQMAFFLYKQLLFGNHGGKETNVKEKKQDFIGKWVFFYWEINWL